MTQRPDRPPKPAEDQQKSLVKTYVTESEKQAVAAAARADGDSESQWVRRLILRELRGRS